MADDYLTRMKRMSARQPNDSMARLGVELMSRVSGEHNIGALHVLGWTVAYLIKRDHDPAAARTFFNTVLDAEFTRG